MHIIICYLNNHSMKYAKSAVNINTIINIQICHFMWDLTQTS